MTTDTPILLLADDDAVSRTMVAGALEGAGFAVIQVEDGEAAVQAFQADKPALVILDVLMPRLDGFGACAAIRRLPTGQQVPILMLTGRDDAESIHAAYAAGATDFATKGLSHRLLAERARFLLRSYAWRHEVLSQRQRLSMVQQLARVGYWETDGDGRTVDVSDIAAAIVGLPRGDLCHLDQLLGSLDAESRESFAASVDEWRDRARPFRLDSRLRNGFRVSIHGAHPTGDARADRSGLMLAIQDTTALHDARERAERLMVEDALTGLPNRARLAELLGKLLDSRAATARLGVIAIRLGGHERVRSGPGCTAAEGLLRTAIDQVRDAVARLKWPVTLGHLGDGQLVALFDSLPSPGTAITAATAMLDSLKRPVEHGEWRTSMTAHAGVSLWPRDGLAATELLDAALSAAESARAAHARCWFFSPEIHLAAQRRLDIESALRRSIRDGLLWVAYQPRVDLDDNRIVGCEALLRLQHPKLGAVAPGEFIPIAEDAGLIAELGEWVLLTACQQAAQWRRDSGRQLVVSVNVSGEQLVAPAHFAGTVRAVLEAAMLPPSALELELTESMIIHANQATLSALEDLRTLGVRIALDDFGTGYSSLGRLSRLPVDCLKIDRSFIAAMATEPAARGITVAVLAMARSLGMRTVAEGIESLSQLLLLREHGCNEGQGYLIARPLPAPDLGRLIDPAAPPPVASHLRVV